MEAAPLSLIKHELKQRRPEDVFELCLRLARFKKENKELLTYLLLEAEDEESYITMIKSEMDKEFEEINKSNVYYAKKSVRKIVKNTNKHIRFSGQKQTEVELRIHFCKRLNALKPFLRRSTVLRNTLERQLVQIQKAVSRLHEDLQFDYNRELEKLNSR